MEVYAYTHNECAANKGLVALAITSFWDISQKVIYFIHVLFTLGIFERKEDVRSEKS